MAIYRSTLPQVFPYCIRRVDNSVIRHFSTLLLTSDTQKAPAGSSFAVVAGMYSDKGLRDIWLSQVSLDRLKEVWPLHPDLQGVEDFPERDPDA